MKRVISIILLMTVFCLPSFGQIREMYDDGEEGVRIIGKVLGIVDPTTDLPDEENLYTLRDLFHDELYDFKRKHENE